MCFLKRTHLHPSRALDVQVLPQYSDHFPLEAGGVVLLGFVAEVRQQVKVFRVVRPFLLDVLRASSSPMQRRPARELVSQDLGGACSQSGDQIALLTIETPNSPQTRAWPFRHAHGGRPERARSCARRDRDAGASLPLLLHAASFPKSTGSESVAESRSRTGGALRGDHVAARRQQHPRSRWVMPW